MRKILYGSIYSAIYAAICSVVVFWIGIFLPRRWFNPNSFWFGTKKWENNGKFYNKFHVSKWKSKLPDMSRYAKRLLSKKLVKMESSEHIKCLIQETCVAEVAHIILIILSIGMIVISNDRLGILYCVLYAFGNFPYIIIQRYNRPRLLKMLDRIKIQERELQNV